MPRDHAPKRCQVTQGCTAAHSHTRAYHPRQSGRLPRARPPDVHFSLVFLFLFFFNDTASTEIYPLSLPGPLPISALSLPRLALPVDPRPLAEQLDRVRES